MKKVILAGAVVAVIVISPLSESWAHGYRYSPGLTVGLSWGIPLYTDVWYSPYWNRPYGDWVWYEGYRVKNRPPKYYRKYRARRARARDVWVSGHWERRGGDWLWITGYWKDHKKHKDHRHGKRWKKRPRRYDRRW